MKVLPNKKQDTLELPASILTDSLNKESLVYKPWGYYVLLEEQQYMKKKNIVLYANMRLSLQMHEYREEFWKILQGIAEVTIGKQVIKLQEADSLWIPIKTFHRVKNIGDTPLVIQEIQRGAQVKEEDILRLDDDFGRL